MPTEIRKQIVTLALEKPELSPRELAVRFTDERQYFVFEATVCRLLKARDLITSPAYIVVKAADEFRDKTVAPNQLWQTDFTYLKVVGRGWYDLSTYRHHTKCLATRHADANGKALSQSEIRQPYIRAPFMFRDQKDRLALRDWSNRAAVNRFSAGIETHADLILTGNASKM